MNARVVITVLATMCIVSLAACVRRDETALEVWTYDSLVAEWGAGPRLAALFEGSSGIKVKFVSKGDGGQLLASLLLAKNEASADIALGIDDQLAGRALSSGLFRAYAPRDLGAIPAELRFDPSNRLIPFDYGWFAIVWDSSRLAAPPSSLAALASPEFAKKLIIMDPRSSTPGLGLLAWSREAYGEAWPDFWRRLSPSVLAMTPGWDSGYGLFTAGEAPLVLSYSTSPAWHREYEGTDRYRALEFPEGHPREIEAAGILAKAGHPAAAERFMDFLVSEIAQRELPLTQWMFPARDGVPLPASFGAAMRPGRSLPFRTGVDLAGDASVAAAALGAPAPTGAATVSAMPATTPAGE